MASRFALRGDWAGDPGQRAALWLGIALAALVAFLALFAPAGLSRYFFETQDAIVAAVFAVGLALFAFRALPTANIQLPAVGARGALAIAGVTTLMLWAGTYVLFGDYPLSRDEHMAVFDAAIFANGDAAAPLAAEWRAFADALTPTFVLPLPGDAAWVSSYMPVNAALRAAFGLLADDALMNPLLAGVGALALCSIGRRLFPSSPSAQAAALLLYLTSAQMIAAAMTTYAMTGHLALNLVWLALFLRGGRAGHGGAAALGFAATGLHQIVFHPLFVLPFLFHLRRQGAWRTASFYVLCYAGAGLFWMSYPHLVAGAVGAAPAQGATAGALSFIQERILPLLLEREPGGVVLMGFNLLRLIAWQNAALVPLLLIAIPLARRGEGIAQPLYLGILFSIAAMFVLLPYQGHGWGYRYMHGLLGSFALLAAYGWRRLEGERGAAHALLLSGTVLTLCFSLPFLLRQAHSFAAPYARIDRAIERIDADFVVIDSEGNDFFIDQVRNDPYLRNRPLRFSSRHLGLDDLRRLCARGRVAFASRAGMEALGPKVRDPRPSLRFPQLRASLDGAPCVIRG